MWERESCAEVLAIVHKAGIKKFRIVDMSGSVWEADKVHMGLHLGNCRSRYVLYRVFVEDYKVWLEILVDI